MTAGQSAAAGTEPVLSDLVDGVQWLTLNRPDRLNAVTPELYEQLKARVAEAASDQRVKCVVLTGAGKGFCAGKDLKATVAEQKATAGEWLEARIDYLLASSQISKMLHEMEKPTIAMVNGAAAGAGLSLAAACDLRIAGEGAVLTSAFVKVGLPGDMGGTWFWTRILGAAKARRLYLRSERFDAQAALAFGLVDEVISNDGLKAHVSTIAAQFASNSATALRFAKAALNAAPSCTLDEMLEVEAVNTARVGLDAAMQA
ncbi:enoyl-CoA hydratase-related protein [Hyphomonas sp.]|jgi:2-(1,2-epoxy-1,2-dihydrophenyl)acetyl-CoA isomerase|uniref:enoyl-CoA hydratase-related protein n=1 Tax=Hyphomonas sp. TaxID=87 RepID=UPI003001C628